MYVAAVVVCVVDGIKVRNARRAIFATLTSMLASVKSYDSKFCNAWKLQFRRYMATIIHFSLTIS